MDNAPKISITEVSNILKLTRQAVHARLRSKNIESFKRGRSKYITHTQSKCLLNKYYIPKKIAVHHIKGGVGKSTSTDNIGDAANVLGARVLKIDGDFQKNLTIRHNISDEELDKHPVLIDLIMGNGTIEESIINISDGLDLLPSRIENVNLDTALTNSSISLSEILKNILAPIEDIYDLIIIDCPAMLGKFVTAATLYSDFVLCPLNPEKFSIAGLETFKIEISQMKETFNQSVSYMAYLNKFKSTTILSETSVNEALTNEIKNGTAYDIVIKEAQEIPNLQEKHKSLFHSIKSSDVRNDFIELTRKIIEFDNLPNKT